LHAALLGVCTGTPVVQESTVHAIPSSGMTVVLTMCAQPVRASQVSTVHGFVSSQLTAEPPEQTTFWQVWPVMQSVVEQAAPFGRGV
jgi:hypothetical protein